MQQLGSTIWASDVKNAGRNARQLLLQRAKELLLYRTQLRAERAGMQQLTQKNNVHLLQSLHIVILGLDQLLILTTICRSLRVYSVLDEVR